MEQTLMRSRKELADKLHSFSSLDEVLKTSFPEWALSKCGNYIRSVQIYHI
jgi:hypothetical protein